MPARSLATTYSKALSDILILENYINNFSSLDAKHQYLVGEVIMLRLFSILETTFSEVAFKLACGASYRSGTMPVVQLRCSSSADAHVKMLSHNRKKPKRYLQWTKAAFIRDSIEHVLDITDHYYQNIQIHGHLINEMRVVRNHIAHRSASTKADYITLLRTKYGGNPHLTIGAYLISTARSSISNITYYVSSSKIILNDISHG